MLTVADKEKRVTIKEAETRTKIPQRTIRKYVKDFPMIPVGRGQHQTLLFDLEAMELLIYTQHLFKERIPKITIATLIEKRVQPNDALKSDDKIMDIVMDEMGSQIQEIYSEENNQKVEMLTLKHDIPYFDVSSFDEDLDMIPIDDALMERINYSEKMLAEYVNKVTVNEDKLSNQKLILSTQSQQIDDLKIVLEFEKQRNLDSVRAIFEMQDRLKSLENPKSYWQMLKSTLFKKTG
ncbi:helix-turn-helix domain-containing protein [bacterium]|nr:helix-turn-helix domain-containing protein [bacterium]